MVKWTSLTSFLARKWQQKNQKKRFLPQQQRQLPSHHKKPIAKRTKQKKKVSVWTFLSHQNVLQ